MSNIPFFFILGRPRSGTTLLMTILDANPHIIIPPEIPFIPLLYPRYHHCKNWDSPTLNDFYNDLCNLTFGIFYKFTDLPFNKELLKKEILSASADSTFSELIKIIYSNYNSVFPKKEIQLLGDKNPVFSKESYRYVKIFPDAKFIHIRRDYRDHALSMNKAGFGKKNLAFIVYRWKYNLKLIEAFKQKYPEKILMVKYEDLVSEPEIQTKRICNFLAVPYYPEMLLFHQIGNLEELYPEKVMFEYQSSLLKPISKDNIGVWEKKMNDSHIKMCDFVAGNIAEQYGYSRKFKGFNLKGAIIIWFITIRRLLLYPVTKSLYFLPVRTKIFLRKKFSILGIYTH
jgi:hypothetical protein